MVRALEKGLFEPVRSGTKDSGWWHGDDYLFLHLKMSSCGCPVVPEVPLSCRGQGRRQRSAQLGPAGRARSLSCPLMGSTPAATSELHDRSGRCYKCWSQRKWPWPESANSNANSTQTQKTQCKFKKKNPNECGSPGRSVCRWKPPPRSTCCSLWQHFDSNLHVALVTLVSSAGPWAFARTPFVPKT